MACCCAFQSCSRVPSLGLSYCGHGLQDHPCTHSTGLGQLEVLSFLTCIALICPHVVLGHLGLVCIHEKSGDLPHYTWCSVIKPHELEPSWWQDASREVPAYCPAPKPLPLRPAGDQHEPPRLLLLRGACSEHSRTPRPSPRTVPPTAQHCSTHRPTRGRRLHLDPGADEHFREEQHNWHRAVHPFPSSSVTVVFGPCQPWVNVHIYTDTHEH